jgi:hypothetical protein
VFGSDGPAAAVVPAAVGVEVDDAVGVDDDPEVPDPAPLLGVVLEPPPPVGVLVPCTITVPCMNG